MKYNIDLLFSLLLPVLGYLNMKSMKKRADKAIVSKVFAEGLYRFKPVYGDRVMPIAKGYAKGGVFVFIFTIIFPAFMALLKLLK